MTDAHRATRLIPPTLFGECDRDGRLLAGDLELSEWHRRSGGRDEDAIALPGVADLIRQTSAAGVPMTRALLLATDDRVATYWARTTPRGDRIDLELTDSSAAAWPGAVSRDATRQRDFMRTGADWLWEVDERFAVTALSDGATAFFGRPAANLVGRNFNEILTEYAFAETGALMEALKRRINFRDIPVTLALPGEAEQVLLFQGQPILSAQGDFAGMRGTAVEVAPAPERRVAPAAEIKPEEVSATPMPPASVGDILRTPIDSIMEQAHVMQTQTLGPLRSTYVDYAGDISDAARHLRDLLDDLFDVARIDSRTLGLRIETLDLSQLVDRAVSLQQGHAAKSGKPIETHVAAPALAFGDARRIIQILINLIDNAIKYSKDRSRIRISSASEGGRILVHVDDDGPGIPASDRDRIFSKFERLDPDRPDGTGLGLYIARELARAMAGDLIVGASPSGGARFTLSLPQAH